MDEQRQSIILDEDYHNYAYVEIGKEQIERIENFLSELAQLSNNHGLYIAGCGCCGSPFVLEIKSKGRYTIKCNGFELNNLDFVESEEM